jgi:hypothetical protein
MKLARLATMAGAVVLATALGGGGLRRVDQAPRGGGRPLTGSR